MAIPLPTPTAAVTAAIARRRPPTRYSPSAAAGLRLYAAVPIFISARQEIPKTVAVQSLFGVTPSF